MVQQSVKSLGLRFEARIQLELFEALFTRRLEDERIRVPRAMEADFLAPTSPAEARIREAILTHRRQQQQRLERERERQRERLAGAERALARRATRRASEELRIATGKLHWLEGKLADLWRDRAEPRDSRVFPQWYAPVLTLAAGELVLRPMRYQLRPAGRPASDDQRLPGLYNARRDNLTGFWRALFGRQHGVFLVSSFYENVPRHAYAGVALAPGARPTHQVVHFSPVSPAGGSPEMLVPCLWDRWTAAGEAELWSFAAITDDPPPEIRAAGHDRCVVALRPAHLTGWLSPRAGGEAGLLALLADREPLGYEHRPAAAD